MGDTRTFHVSFTMTASDRDIEWFGAPTSEWLDYMLRGGFPPSKDLKARDVGDVSPSDVEVGQGRTGSIFSLEDVKVEEVK